MLGYAVVGTNDLEKSKGFYDAVLGEIGAKQMMPMDRGVMYGTGHPWLAVMTPFDGAPAAPGNGLMVGLMAPSRTAVDSVHAKALASGGTDEGGPGVRGDNPDGFYGAYFRDLDGNKLCVFRMGPA